MLFVSSISSKNITKNNIKLKAIQKQRTEMIDNESVELMSRKEH